MKEWVMMPPYMSVKVRWTTTPGTMCPTLYKECDFFNVPQIYYMCAGLWDGAYGLSSLSETTRKSNCLQMLLQSLRPPAQQTGAIFHWANRVATSTTINYKRNNAVTIVCTTKRRSYFVGKVIHKSLIYFLFGENEQNELTKSFRFVDEDNILFWVFSPVL